MESQCLTRDMAEDLVSVCNHFEIQAILCFDAAGFSQCSNIFLLVIKINILVFLIKFGE